jgi:hypothetical protein
MTKICRFDDEGNKERRLRRQLSDPGTALRTPGKRFPSAPSLLQHHASVPTNIGFSVQTAAVPAEPLTVCNMHLERRLPSSCARAKNNSLVTWLAVLGSLPVICLPGQ